MKTSHTITVALGLALGLSAAASADPRFDHRHDRHAGGRAVVVERHVEVHRAPPRGAYGPVYRVDPRHARAQPRHFARYHRGERLPVAYRQPAYVVTDWRAQRLAAPPRGHQWVRDGRDFALIAVATGLIAQIVLSH